MERSVNKQLRLRIVGFVVIRAPQEPASKDPSQDQIWTIFLQYRVLVPKSANPVLFKGESIL